MTRFRRALDGAALIISLVAAGSLATPAPPATHGASRVRAPATARPRNVILMIPDGCGWSSMALARLYAGRPLVLDAILVGASETHPADGLITDSAAGATAFASGVKTHNYEVGVTPDLQPAATVLEAARARGLSTGLVATTRITDATPAAFAAHVSSRYDETDIAVQELDHRVDVLLGGGRREFLPAAAGGLRKDGRDLTDEARRAGYTLITSRAQLAAAVTPPILGLFAPNNISYEIDRDTLAEPGLAEMTRKALALLARNRRGFFVMVEGSRVDHAAHQRDPATHAREVLAYDDAVAVALEFARRDAHTLVISVADHETGGLSVGLWSERDSTTLVRPEMLRGVRESASRMADEIRGGAAADEVLARGAGVTDLSAEERAALAAGGPGDRGLIGTIGAIESRRADVGWTTWWHTGVDVGLYAWGPGAERLRGTHENTDVGHVIADLLGLDLEGLTARERSATAGPGRR